MKAAIDEGWHIYSASQADGGPVKTSFFFTPAKDYMLIGKITEPTPVTKFENTFGINVSYFEHSVTFRQKIGLKTGYAVVKGKLTYMVCNNEKCLPPEDVQFSVPVN
jgi:hypothetical protein